MDLDLKGKSVVVTGGGSNIGRGIVLGFAAEGACLTIGDIDDVQGEKVAALAREVGAGAAQVKKADITDTVQAQALIQSACDAYGGVDVLVNCLGWDQQMYFVQTNPEFWDKVIKLNYISALNCTQAALNVMIPKNSGAIVSISSDASRMGEPREAVYGGIKAAVNSFMKTVAKENGRYGIRCNSVCPGVTVPDSQDDFGKASMWARPASFTPEQMEKIKKSLPLRKVGRPSDIANAVVFLASSAAGHITGQTLSVSGGYSMIG